MNQLSVWDNKETISETTDMSEEHREKARDEFRASTAAQNMIKIPENDHVRHYVFDFAENVLLPRPQRPLELLHFVTGLKSVTADKSAG